MIDQFQPWYFGVAFAFVFSYCIGMPDMYHFAETPRHRRGDDAPRVEPPAWVRIMARRVEAQISRVWNFGFVSWNYIFRSAVNLSRTFFFNNAQTKSGGGETTAQDVQAGAQQISCTLADLVVSCL